MITSLIKKIRSFVIPLFILGSLCISTPCHAFSNSDFLRVKVNQNTTVGFRAYHSYSIYCNNAKINYNISDGEIFSSSIYNNTDIKLYGHSGLICSGKTIELRQSTENNYFELKDIDGLPYSKYPDNLKLYIMNGTIYCINNVYMENYLKGVVPLEIGSSVPLDALKAQAIAARTYAIKNINKYQSQGFDLTNDTYCQVYGGYYTSYFNSSSPIYKAVESTKGNVITYNNNLIDALFYSSNGGYTAKSEYVYGGSYPYFKEGIDTYDNFDAWTKTFTPSELKNELNKHGIICDDIKDVKINTVQNHYVTSLTLTDVNNKIVNLTNNQTRSYLGVKSMKYDLCSNYNDYNLSSNPDIYIKGFDKTILGNISYIKSLNSNTSVSGDIYAKSKGQTNNTNTFVFNGVGYGHGLGMSQMGAIERAKAGINYKDILLFYYPGTNISINYNN